MSHKQRRQERADPYSIHTTHEVEVIALDGHPAALAKDKAGRAFRVPGGVPGDRLEVRIETRGRKDLWTTIQRIIKPGPGRVEPPCPIVAQCGTCPWQSVTYGHQLAAKGAMVRSALASHPALAKAPVMDPVGITKPVGYRTKIQMPAGGRAGDIKLGFYAPRSHELVPVDHCVVQHPTGERVRRAIVEVLNHHGVSPYDENSHSGDLRYVLLRVAPATDQVGAVLVVRSLDSYDWPVMAAELESIDGLVGVWINENNTDGNAVLGKRTVHLAGSRRLDDVVAGMAFQRNPMSFFQTNHRATEKLIEIVRQMINEPIQTLFDLYAGGGLFALALADRAKEIYLVESHPDAAAAAKATLRGVGVKQSNVVIGRVEEVLPKLAADGIAADAIVIDPPRSGIAAEAVAPIVASQADRIVYVSCNLRSLVRDLKALTALGMKLDQVHTVDMFPHTPHVEVISLLTR